MGKAGHCKKDVDALTVAMLRNTCAGVMMKSIVPAWKLTSRSATLPLQKFTKKQSQLVIEFIVCVHIDQQSNVRTELIQVGNVPESQLYIFNIAAWSGICCDKPEIP